MGKVKDILEVSTKKCEGCGREFPISQFSKAYKNLCKDCYAKMMREKRVEVKKEFKADEVKTPIDWEARRYEIIKAALQNPQFFDNIDSYELLANRVVRIADTIIKRLKGEVLEPTRKEADDGSNR